MTTEPLADYGTDRQKSVIRWLGWFNIGLGIGEIVAPQRVSNWLGLRRGTRVTRLMGIRKVAAGVGILTHTQTAKMFWARAGGDALELVGLLRAADTEHPPARGAIVAMAGITALDVTCARMLASSPDGKRWHKFSASTTVNLPPRDAYEYWRDLENYPAFFKNLRSVRATGKQSHWVAKGSADQDIEWDAEVTEDIPNRRISWRSVGSPSVPNNGSVRLHPIQNGAGTNVRLEVAFQLPASRRLNIAARLQKDLLRFKQIAENGR